MRRELAAPRKGAPARNAKNVVLIILLILLISLAAAAAVKKMRRGGGCCGEHETAEKKVAAADRNKSHYPWIVTLDIGGMTCENCLPMCDKEVIEV